MDNLTSSFPICITFISFSCVIALSKTSSIPWKRMLTVDNLVLSQLLMLEEMLSNFRSVEYSFYYVEVWSFY
jgi:hypothetical protein